MPRTHGRRRRLALLLALVSCTLVGLGLFAAFVALPSLVRARLQALHLGPSEVGRVHLGFRGSEVVGIVLRANESSPPWLTIDRVETDASIARLRSGHILPSRVRVRGATIRLELDADGNLVNAPRFAASNGPPPTPPRVEIDAARVEILQAGRPPFLATGMTGTFEPDAEGARLRLETATPDWLRIRCEGRFGPGYSQGRFVLSGAAPFDSTAERLAAIPFLPREIGGLFEPVGPVDWRVALAYDPAASPSVAFDVLLEPRSTSASHSSLNVTITDVHGRISTDGKRVSFQQVNAKALGGTLTASGTLLLTGRAPKLDLDLDLAGVDLATLPTEWGLSEARARGAVSGRLHVLADLTETAVDVSRTTGRLTATNGSLLGRPIKKLVVTVETPAAKAARRPNEPEGHEVVRPLLTAVSTAFRPKSVPVSNVGGPSILLPTEAAAEIEVDDVELAPLIEDLRRFVESIPSLPIRGRVSGTATANIPLRDLRETNRYRVHSKLGFSSLEYSGVDFGRGEMLLELVAGTLKLREIQTDGPAGLLRGEMSLGISPPGMLKGKLSGERLDARRISAAFAEERDRVDSLVSIRAEAAVPIGRVADPRAWAFDGSFHSQRLRREGSELTDLAGKAILKDGTVSIHDLNASLKGKPITGSLRIDLAAGKAFEGRLDVEDWSLPDILDWIPRIEDKHRVEGRVSAHAELSGSLDPPRLTSRGEVRLHDLIAAKVPLGTIPLSWRTVGEDIVLEPSRVNLFGGSITAEGVFPTEPTRPARFKAEIKGIDSLAFTSALPMSSPPAVTGPLDGRADLAFDPRASRLTGNILLNSSRFTYEGVPIGRVAVNLASKPAGIDFEVVTDGASGRTTFKGSLPQPSEAKPIPDRIDAGVLAVGYSLGDLTRLAKLGRVPTNLKGFLGLNANLRLEPSRDYALGLQGIVEARELKWSDHYPLGRLQGVLARDPSRWRLDRINGDLFGGSALGSVWSEPAAGRPDLVRFDLQVDRASLSRVFAFIPALARESAGYGTVHLTGSHDRALNASAEVYVPKASVFRIPVTDLRIPIEMLVDDDGVTGSLHARTFNARIAGGQVKGEASMRIGSDHTFNLRLDVGSIDLETITRSRTNTARPGSGKIHGKISLGGRDPSDPSTYRGRIDLDLDDASIVDLPILREIDRFLGAARGGLVEDGDLHATLANGKLQIESFTLEGRVLQLHATGTVTVDGDLALDVVVNTNQLIPQTGEALIELIPGLRQALGRGGQATARIGGYLSSRLLKFRIGGNIRNPSVQLDPAAALTSSAVGFFTNVFRLPIAAGAGR